MTGPDRPRDRIVTSVGERRATILDAIAQARREITLSLFRGSDAAIFAELRRAVARGVAVNVLVTSRAKGGKKKLRKLVIPTKPPNVSA